jgi:hypothetical protein
MFGLSITTPAVSYPGNRDAAIHHYTLLLCALLAGCGGGPPAPPPQNPSPMVETTRRHDRVPDARPPGVRLEVDAGLERAVEVFVPDGVDPAVSPRLLVHFHGASYVAEQAVAAQTEPYVLAVVNLGAGSGRYERPFRSGRFSLLGFAGNTAPDHVDHLHALGAFLEGLRSQ